MDIAIVANERFFPGLWATVLSLLGATERLAETVIHVVDGGLEDSSWRRLEEAVARHPSRPALHRIAFDPAVVEGYHLTPGKHPLTYARLLMPDLLDCDRLLYLDADLLVQKDVSELEDVELGDAPAAAVLNEDGCTMAFDFSPGECNRLGVSPAAPYFNAGVMLMDLAAWRRNKLADKCIEILNANRLPREDQSAINLTLSGEIAQLDTSWNRVVNRVHPEAFGRGNPDMILHFTSAKPWLTRQQSPAARLFEKFCSDTGLDLPERTPERTPHAQGPQLQAARGVGYAACAAWHALRGKADKAHDYCEASQFWLRHCADRRARQAAEREAIAAISGRQLRPAWL